MAETLRIVMMPVDETRSMAETDDHEQIIVAFYGEKEWLLGLVAGIVSLSDETVNS